jgi:hypothetical protein
MHKCINNSIGNVYHLEQFVDDFFPYSQKQLGFDKAVTIRFESDQDNAGVMLGKTAYYDPEAMEVVLYTDGRHPKDVMRSLSHELVHHAQNCRGDFTGQDSTGPGYAQSDPHLRNMEREAYTKGNLIFRDFEDLIKTGKINIEIDFSDSGEPKMSLKEWKNNEINTKLMKKWGFLKESKGEPTHDPEEDWQTTGGRPPGALEEEARLEEETPIQQAIKNPELRKNFKITPAGWKDLEQGSRGSAGQRSRGSAGPRGPGGELEEQAGHDGPCGPECGCEEIEEGNAGDWSKMAKKKVNPADVPETWGLGNVGPDPVKAQGNRLPDLHAKGGRRKRPAAAGSKNVFTTEGRTSGKISVREAKEITRRIIERTRKESK